MVKIEVSFSLFVLKIRRTWIQEVEPLRVCLPRFGHAQEVVERRGVHSLTCMQVTKPRVPRCHLERESGNVVQFFAEIGRSFGENRLCLGQEFGMSERHAQ